MTDVVAKKQAFFLEQSFMAFHEASHAICAIYSFLKISYVNIISQKYKLGETYWFVMSADNTKDKRLKKLFLLSELYTIYGGLVGEKMFYKEVCGSSHLPMILREGSSDDFTYASSIISKYNLAPPGKLRFAFKKQVQNNAAKILTTYWDDVRLIAHALYKKIRLSYKDIRSLLVRKSQNKVFWKDRFKKITFIFKENAPSEAAIKSIISTI